MPADWMPGATHRPISYYKDAGRFAHTPLGWILHITTFNGSPFNGFNNAPAGDRKFSHGWVAKSGVFEQYAPFSYQSWAQESGNATYWSIETEGLVNEPLTAAQIATLGRIHRFLGAADGIATKPGQRGIGTHFMGGAAWGGHSCPDPAPGGQGPRSHQRAAIIAASKPTPAPPALTGDKMLLLINDGQKHTFLTDGVQMRWIKTNAEEAYVKYNMVHHFGYPETDPAKVQNYDVPFEQVPFFGVIVGDDPYAATPAPAVTA